MTSPAAPFVHPGAAVSATSQLGDYVVVYPGAELEEASAVRGFTQIWPGVRLERGATLDAGVTLAAPDGGAMSTIVFGAHCRVGANATIGAGVKIGTGAVVEAGCVVAHAVPPHAIVSGVPARVVGYVDSMAQPAPGAGGWHHRAEFPEDEAVVPLGVGAVTLHRNRLVRDPRGDLTAAEFTRDIPFTPKRYFLVFDVPSEKTRGEHAHRQCEQFLVCVKGSCAVVVDDGRTRCEVLLDSPDMGIYLPALTWGIQYKYSSDAVLLVFASHYYEAADYIRNYAEFSAAVGALAA